MCRFRVHFPIDVTHGPSHCAPEGFMGTSSLQPGSPSLSSSFSRNDIPAHCVMLNSSICKHLDHLFGHRCCPGSQVHQLGNTHPPISQINFFQATTCHILSIDRGLGFADVLLTLRRAETAIARKTEKCTNLSIVGYNLTDHEMSALPRLIFNSFQLEAYHNIRRLSSTKRLGKDN